MMHQKYKKLLLSEVEKKILFLALVEDNKCSPHYSVKVFDRNNITGTITVLREKLSKYFKVMYGHDILYTEYYKITRKDGRKVKIGIYRINKVFKAKVNELINPIQNSETIQGSN